MGNAFPGYSLYDDQADKNRHESAMKMLCEKFSVQPAVLKHIYEAILYDLKARARIQQFLTIFVVRTIQDLIGNPASPSMPELDLQQAEKYRKILHGGRTNNGKTNLEPIKGAAGMPLKKDFRNAGRVNIDGSSSVGLH